MSQKFPHIDNVIGDKMIENDTERINDMKESIEFFSNSNKKEREIWIANEFLNNLNIDFNKDEIENNTDEPPDIIFRNARFEIKEIQDNDRKRHYEYIEKLKKAMNGEKTIEAYTPKEHSIQEIANIIESKLENYIIDTKLALSIDMLFYINLFSFGFCEDKKYNLINQNIWKKWRSVSMVENGENNLVFYANNSAPDFIKINVGKFINRNKNL